MTPAVCHDLLAAARAIMHDLSTYGRVEGAAFAQLQAALTRADAVCTTTPTPNADTVRQGRIRDAAPELLAALNALLSPHPGGPESWERAYDAAQVAIAKATGGLGE